MLTSETKNRINACRDILVGKLPLPTDQVELITIALIYKFMDDLDEESVKLGGKASFFVGPLKKYRWRALMPQTVSADERMSLFAEGIETLAGTRTADGKDIATHLPAVFRDVFRNAFLKFRDGRILTMFLTELNGFEYSHSEELGNAFEYLLQCMGTQGENGQFRTPRHIIDFMVACLDPQPRDRILDPACGTGGFLVSAYKHILAQHTSPKAKSPGDRLTHAERKQVYANLCGYDVTDLMVKLSKVNLFLHGFPDPGIHIYDTLSNDARWHEKADLILANPPFMTPKGGVTPHTKFRIAAKKAEVLFTDYIAEHLTPDGRGGVIVPNGIVATTQNAYVKLRRFLVEDSLVAVVSLPAGVFKPYSGVKTSILFLDKKLARTAKEILFLKITADGFDLGDKRNPIAANDLPEAERVVKAWLKGKLDSSFETSIAWKPVEKTALLANRSVSFQADSFFGEKVQSEAAKNCVLSDICDNFAGLWKADEGAKDTVPCKVIRNTNFTKDCRLDLSDVALLDVESRKLATRRLVKGDIILEKSGGGPKQPVGRVVHFDIEGGDAYSLSNFCSALRVKHASEVDAAFLYWMLRGFYLKGGTESLQKQTHGIRNLDLQEFLSTEIPLPPLEEQRRIVAEIEGYQKVLDGARQILAGYRAQIPNNDEWPVKELRELIEEKPKNGYSGKPVQHETKLKVLTLTATTSGKMDITKFKYLDEHIPKDSPCRCRRGDVYLQRGNTKELVGTAALLDVDVTDLIYPDLMIRVRADETMILTTFLLHSLQSLPVREYLMRNAGGAAGNMPKINQGIVESIPIPLPPLSEQRRIVSELDAEAAQMDAVRSLLPRFEAKIQRVLDRVWGTTEPVE